jgi:hypothetical protein
VQQALPGRQTVEDELSGRVGQGGLFTIVRPCQDESAGDWARRGRVDDAPEQDEVCLRGGLLRRWRGGRLREPWRRGQQEGGCRGQEPHQGWSSWIGRF